MLEGARWGIIARPHIAGSSKGRTRAFEACYLGSIPSPAAV